MEVSAPIGSKLGEVLGTPLGVRLGEELGTPLGVRLGPKLGKPQGTSLGMELGATRIKTRRRAGKCVLHYMGWCMNAFRIPFGWFLLHLLWNIEPTIQCKGQINQELFLYPCPFLGEI